MRTTVTVFIVRMDVDVGTYRRMPRRGSLSSTLTLPRQVYLACGFMVLVFELVAVPIITPCLGVRLSQRVGSVFEVPTYLVLPLVSLASGSGLPVTIASLLLLFTSSVCINSVGAACRCGRSIAQARRRAAV